MRQNVWIINHYATEMFSNKAGRHFWFAKYLIKSGYKPTIFCANTRHIDDGVIDTKGKKNIVDYSDNIPFVFVKASGYKGNGFRRIINMFSFYKNLYSSSKFYIKKSGKPDVILASSVHPLTLVAGLKISKKLNIPCICEIRDLWPESLYAYNYFRSKRNFLLKLLYYYERRIYEKADKIIFTMEGGKDYIKDRRWDKENGGSIDVNKVFYINNGVDLDEFDFNKNNFRIDDDDLTNPETYKIAYTGSIRAANNVDFLLDAAKLIKNVKIKFLIWGSGSDAERIRHRIKEERINNVIYKGSVNKRFIPSIINNVNANINANVFSTQKGLESVLKYGMSMNKVFEYLAAGKPIISSPIINPKYDIVKKYDCGIITQVSPKAFAEEIDRFAELSKEKYLDYCKNSRKAAANFDFKNLTKVLVDVIES